MTAIVRETGRTKEAVDRWREHALVGVGAQARQDVGLSPSGRFLMVANQNSHTVAVFHRSEQSGLIEKVAAAQLGTPMAVSAISL